MKCRGRKITVSTEDANTRTRITTLAECAEKCRGTSSLFTFGSDPLMHGCSIYGCKCECEIDASSDGSCTMEYVPDEGIVLYQFDRGKSMYWIKKGFPSNGKNPLFL